MKKANPILKTNAISRRIRNQLPVMISDGAWLKDAREECFAVLIADGIPIAIAFVKAGYTAKDKANSAMSLFKAPRLRARVEAILKARASQPPVSLSEITDMMKRVYVGAIHDTEYNAAHNAAFSLARLYGLVVDRAQLDVVRRPSRDPDAPSEVALGDWIEALPSQGPGLDHGSRHEPRHKSANPLISLECNSPAKGLAEPSTERSATGRSIQGPTIDATAYGSDLDAGGPGRTGNGAPTRGVTGTPTPGAFSGGSPFGDEGTPFPKIEDLF